jgi:transposase
VMLDDKAVTRAPGQPAIVVELSHGHRVSIFSSASPAMAAAVVEVLAR